jgi:hypothetical protein
MESDVAPLIVIVVGMHRSGTSALAGLLHENGIFMGEDVNFIPKPSLENPKGFYENYLFRKINDKIIEKSGYRVKSWKPKIPIMKSGFFLRYKMKALLKRYDRDFEKWGWKDPRTCLTFPLWWTQMDRLKKVDMCRIVYIHRDPFAVARSMVKRNNTDYETALKIWLHYNNVVFQYIECQTRMRTHFLEFERLCRYPAKIAEEIFAFLEQEFDSDAVYEMIEPKLNRHSFGSMPEIAEDTYRRVKKMADKLRKISRKDSA